MAIPDECYDVILIDDDHGPMDFYVAAMELKGLKVRHIDNVDDAWLYFEEKSSPNPPRLFVIDMMMPPGLYLTMEETNGGMETGLHVIAKCRKKFPSVPVICLSNAMCKESVAPLKGVLHEAKYHRTPLNFASIVLDELSQSGKL
ncbi:hypothetical protein [Prosthecobacter sp.]|uniref:hypothetical protein n=1 Tax=Prosthecobacter sp. TaxID=1965333 RepID=UPI002ABA2868|nr:hypothetical protein [Prosthecobacter sp.]MDZ4403779.1 hypothetical protein [Prosthecobacter sp.]